MRHAFGGCAIRPPVTPIPCCGPGAGISGKSASYVGSCMLVSAAAAILSPSDCLLGRCCEPGVPARARVVPRCTGYVLGCPRRLAVGCFVPLLQMLQQQQHHCKLLQQRWLAAASGGDRLLTRCHRRVSDSSVPVPVRAAAQTSRWLWRWRGRPRERQARCS